MQGRGGESESERKGKRVIRVCGELIFLSMPDYGKKTFSEWSDYLLTTP